MARTGCPSVPVVAFHRTGVRLLGDEGQQPCACSLYLRQCKPEHETNPMGGALVNGCKSVAVNKRTPFELLRSNGAIESNDDWWWQHA